jgi:long-chain acyl-CoA synthetase
MLFEQAERYGNNPFLWRKVDEDYHPSSWREVASDVRRFANGLAALGVTPGDRVVLIAENRPEWVIAEMAIMSAGGLPVPTHPTNSVRDHSHILSDTGAKAAIISTAQPAQDVLSAIRDAADLSFVVVIEGPTPTCNLPVHRWHEVMELGATQNVDIDRIVAGTHEQDVACLIYTSGTTGPPKGVMQRHASILTNCRGAHRLLQDVGGGNEVFLSFLPLSHAYEHTCGLHFPISIGAQIYFAEGLERLPKNLREVRPTVLIGVPRLCEVIRRRTLSTMKHRSKVTQWLFRKAIALGSKRYERHGRLNPAERLLNTVLDVVVRNQFQAQFGGRLKAIICGGGPLSYDVGLFFESLGVPVLEGYGVTETSPVVSCNRPSRNKLGTAGLPFEGVDVRIANDGEVLVRGSVVMAGYWNNPSGTDAVLKDGWLQTGDVGSIDGDGFLRITGRKKDIIVLSGGDNVSPERVEELLVREPEIVQAVVYGDQRSHLVALIVPDPVFLRQWRSDTKAGHAEAKILTDPAFVKDITRAIEKANTGLSAAERIKGSLIAREPFTVENGLMTPTFKTRRHKVLERYGAELDALY